jgi:uncharacterized protein (TIGR03435 family)
MKFAVLMWLAFWQGSETPAKFDIADVHLSPKVQNPFPRVSPARGGRYEVKNASMVDLIHFAYNYDADKILGGPSWLELDRFDVIAKVPPDTAPEARNEMLQSLLAERFKLVVHKETKPLPTYALTVGKKPQLREAEASDEPGCKPQTSSANAPPTEGGVRLMMMMNGSPMTLNLGPGGTITYMCRGMSMDSFVTQLRTMMGASLGTNPVSNETGLKGKYNFDLRYSIGIIGPMMQQNGERITVQEAIEKQLGLKVEERQVPTPVLVVDKVNRTPTENSPEVAKELPPVPMPTEFEVASVKPAPPAVAGMPQMQRFNTQPGGRLTVENMPLRFLVYRAFNINNNDQIAELPKFADTERFDITAKVASTGPTAPPLDQEAMAPLMKSLLTERFGLKYHTEDRPVTAYALVAAKPKMKKADPNARTSCKNANTAPGVPPGSRVLICQNAPMSLLAERLQNIAPDLQTPVTDATGLEGGWDFTLYFSPMAGMSMGGRGGGGGGGDAIPAASDPNGGYTIFEAIEKQLGLKLEKQKRTMPMIVIDHLEQKPTDN